jgi:uncharacterized membrane protein YidH (DUF202 family)
MRGLLVPCGAAIVPEVRVPEVRRAQCFGRCLRNPGVALNTTKLIAVVLIAAGVLGLVYGSFSYTKDSHDIKIGPLELSMKEKQTVNVPVWAGVAAIVVGGALLLVGGRK